MIDVKQNFVSIATVISILGLIYLALWQTKTLGCCLVRRKVSQVFQMRRIEKVLRTTGLNKLKINPCFTWLVK